METFDDFRKETQNFLVEASKIIGWCIAVVVVFVLSLCSLSVTLPIDLFLVFIGFIIGIVTNKFPTRLAQFKTTRLVWKIFDALNN